MVNNYKKENIVSIGREVFDIEISELLKVKKSLSSSFENAVSFIKDCKGKVVVTGIGKSGIIGHKISASLASTGTHSIYMNAAEGLHGDLGMINSDDIVIAISNSGNSTEVIQLLPSIKTIGSKIIAITGHLDSTLAKTADVVLNTGVEREACPMNIAPTSSTTATLVMGDALTVALTHLNNFKPEKFAIYHPGGTLGRKLLTRVEDVMQLKENVATANKTDSLLLIVDKLTRKNLGIVCVLDHQKVIGIITDGDIRRCLNNHREGFFNMNASDIMSINFKSVTKNLMVYEALNLMENNEFKISSMPVLNNGELEGVIRLHDLYDF